MRPSLLTLPSSLLSLLPWDGGTDLSPVADGRLANARAQHHVFGLQESLGKTLQR